MAVQQPDSAEKIIMKYFASVTKDAFTLKDKRIQPRPLMVSAGLARGYTCPPDCGACCPKFSLDYLPEEEHPPGVAKRYVKFNGREVPIFTDLQRDNSTKFCRHVSTVDARCAIHSVRPFSCDIELMRCYMGTDRPYNRISVGPYGRAWNMTRVVDQQKGTLCEILQPSDHSIAESIRKLERLQAWTIHFGLDETWIPRIIDFLRNGEWRQGNITLEP